MSLLLCNKIIILKRFYFLIFALQVVFAQAQIAFERDTSFPIIVDGNPLPLAWSGGLNSVQFNQMDVNGDGKTDWVLFDRTANAVRIFLSETTYRFAPELSYLFPDNLSNFLLIRDFDADGRPDLFTGSSLGIKVFKNVSEEGEAAQFQELLFYNPPAPQKSEVILSQGFSTKINIQLQFDDVPALHDIDQDGDMDILVMAFSGNGQIEFHKNLSVEKYNKPDSLDFVRITQAWGGVRECGCGVFTFNNQPCPTNTRVKHAGGKALLVQDVNGDNQADLIFSELACETPYVLINNQQSETAQFSQADVFPNTYQANGLYPVVFSADVNQDQKQDVVISNGVFARSDAETDFSQSTTQFINNGTNSNLQLSNAEPFALQTQQFDVGDNSVPAFFDADGDGDLDVLISEMGRPIGNNQLVAGIYLLKNIGNNISPSYVLETDNWLNFRSSNFYNLKIQFADINSDLRSDLVFSATDISNTTKIYFIENIANTGFSPGSLSTTNITLAFNENFLFYDVNVDGKVDLLIGKSTGSVELWQQSLPTSWQVISNSYKGLVPTFDYTNPGLLATDINNDGKTDLVLTNTKGQLLFFDDFINQNTLNRNEESWLLNPLTKAYENPNLGGRVWLSAYSQNEIIYLIAGNTLGGLQFFKSIESENSFSIYPNPMEAGENVVIETSQSGNLLLIDSLGRTVWQTTAIKGKQEIRLPELQPGMYIATFRSGRKKFIKRLIVI